MHHGSHALLGLHGCFHSEGPMASSFSASLVIHVCQPCTRGCNTPSGGQVGGDSPATKRTLYLWLSWCFVFCIINLEEVKRQLEEGPKISDLLLFKMLVLPPVGTVYLSNLNYWSHPLFLYFYICLRFTEQPILHIQTQGQYTYRIIQISNKCLLPNRQENVAEHTILHIYIYIHR